MPKYDLTYALNDVYYNKVMKKKQNKYSIEVNEKQLATLIASTEVFARIGIGQFWAAWDYLPWAEIQDYKAWHKAKKQIEEIISKFTIDNVDGSCRSLGNASPKVNETHQIAWDLYQVFRHRLSWDKAIEKGYVEHENSPRNWKEMMGVSYDDPMNHTEQGLAQIYKPIDDIDIEEEIKTLKRAAKKVLKSKKSAKAFLNSVRAKRKDDDWKHDK